MTQAQIYLAEQRGYSQMTHFQSYHTFNFGQYIAENREPFGDLFVVNDDILTAGYTLNMTLEDNFDVMLIPLVGGLEYNNELEMGFIETGEIQVFSGKKGMSYQLRNPYETESINFLQIWVRNTTSNLTPTIQQNTFDLGDTNRLLPLFKTSNQQGFIGKYDGRKKGLLRPTQSNARFFCFVINGAFEVQDRLLHARDGLALENFEEIDFEALSNDAILFVLTDYIPV